MLDAAIQLTIAVAGAMTGAVVGAATQHFLPKIEDSRRTNKRSDLVGDWESVSHGGDDERVKDRIKVFLRSGRLHLVNTVNNSIYSYEAICEVKAGNVLHGEWKSMLPGASAGGNLILWISPHGKYMYGIYTGCKKQALCRKRVTTLPSESHARSDSCTCFSLMIE